MGIEPTYSAWKAAALPLSYTRMASLLPPAGPRRKPRGAGAFPAALRRAARGLICARPPALRRSPRGASPLDLSRLTDSLTRRLEDGLAGDRRGLFDPVIRLGVTGLSRAGKTVFITSLVANLLDRGRMPQLRAAAEGRILAAYLQPQPDHTIPRFAFEDHLAALTRARAALAREHALDLDAAAVAAARAARACSPA